MGLSMQSYEYGGGGDEPYEFRGQTANLAAKFRQLTSQSMILSNFGSPSNWLIEAMVLHVHAEFNKSRETDSGVWVSENSMP